MAFERSSSADTADFTEGIQKYQGLRSNFETGEGGGGHRSILGGGRGA